MTRIVWLQAALDDLRSIHDYIARVASIGADARYSTDKLPDIRLSIFLWE